MPTNITTYVNKMPQSLASFNSENIANSFSVAANNTLTTSQWISWHKDRPLMLFTSKGVCHVWDKDWKVYGWWEGSSSEIIFLDGGGQGVGGDIKVTIDSQGDVSMAK